MKRFQCARVSGWISIVLVVLVLTGISGCHRAVPTGTVSGTAVCKGKPLTGGEIVFASADKLHAASGELDAQGKYTLRKPLEVGQYRVAFVPPVPELDENNSTPQRPKPSPVEFKRQNTETSDLVFEIKPGENTADFEF